MSELIRVLLTPSCWLQNSAYCPLWDAKLNELMERHSFLANDSCYATIGTARVWVANHPYASFTFMNVRPKRRTILRAMDKLRKERGNPVVEAIERLK